MRAALRLPNPNRGRSALGSAKKFPLPPREQDVAQRSAVVCPLDGQAKTVEHRRFLVELSTATSSSRIVPDLILAPRSSLILVKAAPAQKCRVLE